VIFRVSQSLVQAHAPLCGEMSDQRRALLIVQQLTDGCGRSGDDVTHTLNCPVHPQFVVPGNATVLLQRALVPFRGVMFLGLIE
jgi:hypothetical protein